MLVTGSERNPVFQLEPVPLLSQPLVGPSTVIRAMGAGALQTIHPNTDGSLGVRSHEGFTPYLPRYPVADKAFFAKTPLIVVLGVVGHHVRVYVGIVLVPLRWSDEHVRCAPFDA